MKPASWRASMARSSTVTEWLLASHSINSLISKGTVPPTERPLTPSQQKGRGERVETSPAMCEGLSESDPVGASQRLWNVADSLSGTWTVGGLFKVETTGGTPIIELHPAGYTPRLSPSGSRDYSGSRRSGRHAPDRHGGPNHFLSTRGTPSPRPEAALSAPMPPFTEP